MRMRPDHIQLGIADLNEGVALIQKLTGLDAVFGGVHPIYGTSNALISLGSNSYLEILALDPARMDLHNARTDRIRSLSGPTILTFAMQTDTIQKKLDATQGLADLRSKLDPGSRKKPDGTKLEWTSLLIDSSFGPQIPFFIDWRHAPHPSVSSPSGCEWVSFEVLHPQAEALQDIYKQLEIDIPVVAAPKPGFQARIATPRGLMVLLG